MSGRRLLAVGAVVSLIAVRAGGYRLRYLASRMLTAVPGELVPPQFRVLPPPAPEYVGVWDVTPEEARTKLRDDLGFRQLVRAYFHSYDRDGRTVHEVGSYVFRPDGFISTHQLHVRLFPTAEGRTELWCHWELNANRSPLAHLKRIGYDPAAGERRLRRLLADESLSMPDEGDLPPGVDP